MQFKTNVERLTHPQAKLIPQDLWDDRSLFHEILPDELLPIMQAGADKLAMVMQEALCTFETPQIKKCAWLALALSHPNLKLKTLISFGKLLSIYDEIFSLAAAMGRFDVLGYLEEEAPDKFRNMIKLYGCSAFQKAAQNGHLKVLRYLEEKAPDELRDMIRANNYYIFSLAAKNGHLEVLHYLEEKAPNELRDMIKAEDYYAFRLSAKYGHLEVLHYLEEKAPDELRNMIQADSYFAFGLTAQNGHLEILRHLEEKAPNELRDMIKAEDYSAFQLAAQNGHLEVLRYLEEKAPDEFRDMIKASNYAAFQCTAQNGHLEVLGYLEEKAPDELRDMIRANNYYIFSLTAKNGHLEVLHYLEEKASDELRDMIRADNYLAFRWAAKNGHLQILRYLEEKVPNELCDMIQFLDYYAFRIAAENRHQDVIQYLLSHATCFNYAEQHVQEYGYFVNPFVEEKINALRIQKNELEQINPHAVFDIEDAATCKLLFYVLRNLIRRNDAALQDDILFLLNIPSVKALVHRAVTPNEPNELLRLAVRISNEGAASLLLNIPAVRELAQQNNYYQHENRGQLDLRALSQNRESSMTALSEGERERLQKAIERYQPLIAEAGVKNVMDDLRNTLTARYAANPARYQDNKGIEHILPLQWDDFRRLDLQGQIYEKALQAYAKHKDHTAWRYLSKPNPWMHEHASYVYVDENNHNEKWSTFEEYQSEICLYYLGAMDAEMPAIDGYTLETRLDGFIDELVHIGRAHNWDNERYVLDEEGNKQIDESGAPIMEEYDDLEKDRPSCCSGVKRRLFQSVRGHPLFIILTSEVLELELREFVREHVKSMMNDNNRVAIKGAWNKVLEGNTLQPQDIEALRTLDISQDKQNDFMNFLGKKYGHQFEDSLRFTKQIKDAFEYKNKNDAHILNFGHVHPEEFFEDAALKNTSTTQSANGFFALQSERSVGDGEMEIDLPGPHI